MSTSPNPPQKLLDQVSHALRLKHYSYRTETSSLGWIKRYTLFHHKRHPAELGPPEIETFLSHLTVHENVAASIQNQAVAKKYPNAAWE